MRKQKLTKKLKRIIVRKVSLLRKQVFLLSEKLKSSILSFYLKNSLKSSVIFLFSAFVTLFGFWSFFKPDIDLVFTEPIKSNNIFTSRFTLENNGESNVYNILFDYDVTKFNAVLGNNIKFNNCALASSSKTPRFKSLPINSKSVFDIDMFQNLLDFGDDVDNMISFDASLEIRIEYDYWFIFSKNQLFKFHTSPLTSGKLIWLQDQ